MRISDWSSDVCSSDLKAAVFHLAQDAGAPHPVRAAVRCHRFPRAREPRRSLLSGLGRDPPPLAAGAGALRGLDFDCAAQRLTVAPHHDLHQRPDPDRTPAPPARESPTRELATVGYANRTQTV